MRNKILRRLALNAKNRMINKSEGGTVKKEGVLSPNVKFKVFSGEDEFFVEKARNVYLEDPLNPFAKLMDLDTFKRLDQRGKEKYLFDTVDKYAKLKEKFDREAQSISM